MSTEVLPEYPKSLNNGTRMVEFYFTPSASYPTGGEIVTAQELGVSYITNAGGAIFSNSGTYTLWPIFTLGPVTQFKYLIVVFATGAQVGNGTDLSAERFRGFVFADR